ncbi:helix-turn-helix domain-containing protein [Planosporangium sp. 12N6]|uniref:helix-turn-helix domain-containing protein n=1 Tax=Planosporangium spinosum TaxID=3402278 RepID=UPI003CE94806
MEIDLVPELGRRLRALRTAAGRTIASVAVDAGLSVPYVANLENGRGNPTVAALARLAGALGATLRVEVGDAGRPTGAADLPESLVRFARLRRFADEAERLAAATGQPVPVVRERLLGAMAGIGALPGRTLGELDWHRVLDTVVLITRA